MYTKRIQRFLNDNNNSTELMKAMEDQQTIVNIVSELNIFHSISDVIYIRKREAKNTFHINVVKNDYSVLSPTNSILFHMKCLLY